MNIADAQSAEKVQGALDWMHDLTGYNFLPAGYKRPIRNTASAIPLVDGPGFQVILNSVLAMSADRNLNPAENDIMVSLVDAVTRVDDHRETFLNATLDNAQKLVDILQKYLSQLSKESPDRIYALWTLIQLANQCDKLPSSFWLLEHGKPLPFAIPMGNATICRVNMDAYGAVVLKRVSISYHRRTEENNGRMKRTFREETLIWAQLKHSRILPFLGVMDMPLLDWHSSLALVSPEIETSLDVFVANEEVLDRPVRDRLLDDVAAALEYMHMHNIVHCDVKPENVLVETNKGVVLRALLFDFGASTIDTSLIPDDLHRYAGTIIWTAPETLFGPAHYSGRVNTHYVSTRRDVWSFGHLCRWICTGVRPYEEMPNMSELLRYGEGMPRPTPSGQPICKMDNKLWENVIACYEDRETRPSITEIRKAFKLCSGEMTADFPFENLTQGDPVEVKELQTDGNWLIRGPNDVERSVAPAQVQVTCSGRVRMNRDLVVDELDMCFNSPPIHLTVGEELDSVETTPRDRYLVLRKGDTFFTVENTDSVVSLIAA